MRLSYFWVASFGLSSFFHQVQLEKQDIALLEKIPPVRGLEFRSGEMINVVNHLRKLGKDKALAALQEHLRSHGEHDKILIVCRLLFVNPERWPLPALGVPGPGINENVVKEFPLFPIALSDRVPFLLVTGYSSRGRTKAGIECLKFCEGLSLVKEDYPFTGYEKAADALTKTESFRQLYEKPDRHVMAWMISLQGKTKEGNK